MATAGLRAAQLVVLGLSVWACGSTKGSNPGGAGRDAASGNTTTATTSMSTTTSGASTGGAPATATGSSETSNASVATLNTATTAGPDTTGTSTTGGPPALGPDGFPSSCPEVVALDPAATQGTHVTLSVEFNGVPFVFGEPNALAAGGTLLPTNFRFYLSQFTLHAGGQSLPAAPVDARGAVLPFGVQLVNAEDPASLEFDLMAAPGAYDGLSFLLGLSEGCNLTTQALVPPLDQASQLKWPHALGFLFLRFEGNLDELADPATPTAVHMGAAAGENGRAPYFHLDVAPAQAPSTLTLGVSFDAILQGASTETDLSDFSLIPPAPPTLDPEILAGERLRRAASSVGLFTLSVP